MKAHQKLLGNMQRKKKQKMDKKGAIKMKVVLLIEEAVDAQQLEEKIRNKTTISRDNGKYHFTLSGVAGTVDTINNKRAIVYERYFDDSLGRFENRYAYYSYDKGVWREQTRPLLIGDKDEIVLDVIKQRIKEQ